LDRIELGQTESSGSYRLKWVSRLRRIVRVLLACFAALLLIIGSEVAMGWHCDLEGQTPPPIPESQERRIATAGIKDYDRPEDDTYLSYPEWYIVWSYQEKADFQEKHLPSGFPYFGEVRQYWSSYCCISRLTRGKYPFNGGEQVMLVVIGSSFSAEYILKGAYEKTIGKLSEWTSSHQPVEEDQYAYKVAREYADFVHVRPFYEFRFARHLAELWRETPLWGEHPLRKWERKFFLTADFAFEAVYSWVIEHGTYATYGHEPAETYAWIDNADKTILQSVPGVKVVSQVGPMAFIVDIPRYQQFTEIASALAERGVHFVDIAGNSEILLSALAPQSWRYDNIDAHPLFSSPVLTHPGLNRMVLRCDVLFLRLALQRLNSGGATIEHIYDY
jgi:hypothetical protein